MSVLAGTDFFTAEVLTWRGLVTYYVLFFIHLDTRKVSIAGITEHPDAAWMEQMGRNVTWEGWGFLQDRRYLLHDRDAKFSDRFRNTVMAGGGRVEDWRHGSVGSAYPLLPVSFGSASLADDPAGDGAKPEGTCCRSWDLVICNEAPGSGSKPSRQWRGSTPITSVVPDSVRKAVVTVGVKPG